MGRTVGSVARRPARRDVRKGVVARVLSAVKFQWRVHTAATAFLALGLVFGTAFVLLIPPTQAADETTHFYRAYQLSQGDLFAETVEEHGYGAVLPSDVYTVSRQLFADIPSHHEKLYDYHQIPGLLKQRIDFSQTMPVHIEGASVYSPVGYIPQIIAIWVAKLVYPSVTLMYYLGRFASLAVWLALMYVAIRLMPSSKWALVVLALTPMSVAQGTLVSADPVINSLAFVTVAGVLYLRRRNQQLGWRAIALLFAAILALSLCKPIFFVFGLLILLIPPRLLGGMKRYLLVAGSIIFSALLVTALWNAQVKGYGAGINYYYYPNVDIDPARQIVSILSGPGNYLFALFNSYFSSLGDLMTTTFVGRLGWWDVDMPSWLVVLVYLLIAAAVLMREPGSRTFSRMERWVAGSVLVLGFLAINTVLYMTITRVGADYITGLQGRYLIALTPLLVVVVGGLLQTVDWERKAKRFIPAIIAVILTSSLAVTVSRFV